MGSDTTCRSRRVRRLLALAVSALLAGCRGTGTPELLFKAPLQRMPRSMQRAYPDLPPGDSIELRLEGEWFDPPRELTVVPRSAADLSSPIAASEAAYSAFKQYDDDWIVASFAEGDRDDIRGFLADSGVRSGSRRYYDTIRSKHVHGWARYLVGNTEYRLVFVSLTHADSTRRMETFVLEAGEWRRTNRLARERDFQVAWNAYRVGTIVPE